MLPALLRNDPNLDTLFIPHDECPQLHQINAINKEVNALKPLIKDTKDLSGRLAKEVVGQRLDCNGQRLDEYEDDLYLEAVGVPERAGERVDSVLVDNREAEKAVPKKRRAMRSSKLRRPTRRWWKSMELQNCREQQDEPHNEATKNACVDAIAEIETRKEGIATKLAEQQKKQASTFEKHYDLSKSEARSRMRSSLRTSKRARSRSSASSKARRISRRSRQRRRERAASRHPSRSKKPSTLKSWRRCKAAGEADHVYVNETKTNTACKKRQAILDQQEMQWKSGRFDDVREKRDQWFHDATMQIKHRKFLESSLCEKLAGHGIAADVFEGIYKQATDDAQAKMNAFQGECIVEGGEENETEEETADRENRKRKYQQFYDKKTAKRTRTTTAMKWR